MSHHSSAQSVRLSPPPTPLVLRTSADFDAGRPASTGLSPEMSLSEFFYRYFVPVYLRSRMADPKTIAEYQTAIRLWVRFTWDPALRIIDNAACAAFVVEDMERRDGRPRSPNTIRKHCTHLQMILNLCGPQTREFPAAATPYGLFGDDPFGRPRIVPWFSKPPERDKLPEDGLTIDEIGRLLKAADSAIKPVLPECPAPRWWRGLLRFGYNSGLRRGTLLVLCRSWIRPFEDAGILSLPGRAAKRGRPKLIYLSPEAMAALAEMPTGELVFPWPESIVSFNRSRIRLWKAADVPLAHKFHGLRKAIGTELWRRDPLAAQLQLAHESQATTRKSYVAPEALGAALAHMIGPAMRRVRQPKAAVDNRQRELF